MTQKTCFKCSKLLPISSFYKHKRMRDGHLNKCKDCCRHDSLENRKKNIDRIRAYDRKRGNRQSSDYIKQYRKKYPNKYKSHIIVGNAIRDKKLFREPCEKCGTKNNIHAHHDDYKKPLNVRWLCATHHKEHHEINGEGANP